MIVCISVLSVFADLDGGVTRGDITCLLLSDD